MIQAKLAELAAKFASQLIMVAVLAALSGVGWLGFRHHYIEIGKRQALEGVEAQDQEAINEANQARGRVRGCIHDGGVWDVTEGKCDR